MAEHSTAGSESMLGREVFGPMWAIVDLSAVARTEPPVDLRHVHPGSFVTAHRAELDQLLQVIRDAGDFSAATMAIVEELGAWGSDRTVMAEFLLMWSGAIEAYPPDTGDPAVLRRLVGVGSDQQLVKFMHALVGAAIVRGPGVEQASALVVDAVRRAGALLGRDPRLAASDTFRLWRAVELPGILSPDSASPEPAKTSYRLFDHAMEPLTAETR